MQNRKKLKGTKIFISEEYSTRVLEARKKLIPEMQNMHTLDTTC